jgi:AcrR family transcriptional regulator
MSTEEDRLSVQKRVPVTRDRILDVAFALADDEGLQAVTMRRVGKELGVEGMALYNHVRDKDDILDGIVERVLAQIPLPSAEAEWKDAMRARAEGARHVFLQHTWAIGLLEARHANSSPARLQYFEAVLACLRTAGFDATMAMRAFSTLDSFVYGAILQEITLPFDTADSLEAIGEDLLEQMGAAYPHLTEATLRAMQDGWSHAEQFRFGLDLVIEALERRREQR